MECILFNDENEDTRLKQLLNDLTKLGAKIRLFDGEVIKDKEVSVEYLKNRFNRYREIQQQNEELDD